MIKQHGIVFFILFVIISLQSITLAISTNKENNFVDQKKEQEITIEQSKQNYPSFKDDGERYRVLFSPLWGGEWIKDLFESYGFYESKVKAFWNLLWSNIPMKGRSIV